MPKQANKTVDTQNAPSGAVGKYWIINGKPNGAFLIPSRSVGWQKLSALSNFEVQEAFPHMRGAAIKELGVNKAMRKAQTYYFNSDGEYLTEDETEARFALNSALAWDIGPVETKKGAGLHPFSLPIKDTSPLFGTDEEASPQDDLPSFMRNKNQ